MAAPVHFTVLGQVDDPAVYAALAAIQEVKAKDAAVESDEQTFTEVEWEECLRKQQLNLGGACYGHKTSPLVLKDGAFLGGLKALAACLKEQFEYEADMTVDTHQVSAVEALRKRLIETGSKNVYTYMDIKVGTGSSRRVIFELYPELCPKAVENFRVLCSGERGDKLCYKNSPFHRVVPDGWVQGGDIFRGKGDAGQSIYGEPFADECFSLPLDDKPGVLAMANKGAHTNSSQFFVTVAPLPWLQYKVVGIGRVVTGLSTLRAMTKVKALNERPVENCVVSGCGVLDLATDSTSLLGGPFIANNIAK